MKYLFQLILGIIVVLALQNNALAASSIKIGVVDIQKLQEQSAAVQKTKAQLREKFENLQKKLDEEKNALLKLEEELQKQSMMLSLDAKQDKTRELERKTRYYKYLYDDYSQEMKSEESEATQKLQQEIQEVVRMIGAKDGYTLILQKNTTGLIFTDDALDITEEVSKAYDAMHQ